MAKSIDMRAAAAKFFTASQFAVAGASSIQSKFGYKVFAWYLQHGLQAVPLNPTIPDITCAGRKFDTVASASALSHPRTTSLSVITPPAVTAMVLQEAKEAGILAVWLQPGSFTPKELEYAMENWPDAAIGGYEDGTVGGEGWCVLVDGDTAIEGAEKLSAKPASERKGSSRVSKRAKKIEPVVGRKARVKKHVMNHINKTEHMRIRRVLANLEG